MFHCELQNVGLFQFALSDLCEMFTSVRFFLSQQPRFIHKVSKISKYMWKRFAIFVAAYSRCCCNNSPGETSTHPNTG